MDRWIAPRQLKQATTHQDPRLDAIQALDGLSPDDPELPDKLAKALRQFLQGALGIKTEDKSLEELIPGTDSLARASDWRVLLHSLEDRRFSRGNPPLDNLLEAARSLVREDMCPRTET